MNIWGITDTGVVREQNQDYYHIELLEENVGLAVVCDGMGGAKAGNVASHMAVETFLETAGAQPPEQWKNEPEAVLHFAAEQANQAVYFRAGIDPDCRGMGTTMVAALVVEQTAYLLNIGDSRAYLIRPDGISRLTRDHSVVEALVARGEITPEEARQHPQKISSPESWGRKPNSAPTCTANSSVPETYCSSVRTGSSTWSPTRRSSMRSCTAARLRTAASACWISHCPGALRTM